MGSDDTQRVVADVPEDAHAMAMERLAHGELSEIIRDAVNTVAYGGGWDRHTLIDRQIEQKRDEIRDLRSQRRDIDSAIESAEDELEELLRDREEAETKEDQFEGALWSFEQSFRAGEIGHLTPDHPKLATLAEQFGKEVEVVHTKLVDRNPDVPDRAFEKYEPSLDPRAKLTDRFDGLDEDEVATPVDERRSL